jgi:hypothetical protein
MPLPILPRLPCGPKYLEVETISDLPYITRAASGKDAILAESGAAQRATSADLDFLPSISTSPIASIIRIPAPNMRNISGD